MNILKLWSIKTKEIVKISKLSEKELQDLLKKNLIEQDEIKNLFLESSEYQKNKENEENEKTEDSTIDFKKKIFKIINEVNPKKVSKRLNKLKEKIIDALRMDNINKFMTEKDWNEIKKFIEKQDKDNKMKNENFENFENFFKSMTFERIEIIEKELANRINELAWNTENTIENWVSDVDKVLKKIEN